MCMCVVCRPDYAGTAQASGSTRTTQCTDAGENLFTDTLGQHMSKAQQPFRVTLDAATTSREGQVVNS